MPLPAVIGFNYEMSLCPMFIRSSPTETHATESMQAVYDRILTHAVIQDV